MPSATNVFAKFLERHGMPKKGGVKPPHSKANPESRIT